MSIQAVELTKVGIAATISPDTFESILEVIKLSGRSKSAAIEMLLTKGYEVWKNERIARAYQGEMKKNE